MNIFEAIKNSIHRGIEFRNQRLFEWSLPRQIGVTSWILDQIKQDILEGKSVVYASNFKMLYMKNLLIRDEELYRALYRRIFIVNENTYNNLRGRTIHKIYGDNLNYWRPMNKRNFIESFLPVLSHDRDNYMLLLNTTEGEEYNG